MSKINLKFNGDKVSVNNLKDNFSKSFLKEVRKNKNENVFGFIPLGGKSRAYYNPKKGIVISRRAYDSYVDTARTENLGRGSFEKKAKLNYKKNVVEHFARPAKGRKSSLKRDDDFKLVNSAIGKAEKRSVDKVSKKEIIEGALVYFDREDPMAIFNFLNSWKNKKPTPYAYYINLQIYDEDKGKIYFRNFVPTTDINVPPPDEYPEEYSSGETPYPGVVLSVAVGLVFTAEDRTDYKEKNSNRKTIKKVKKVKKVKKS